MTDIQFATYIRKQTRTDQYTFTDADIMIFANSIKDELAGRISKVDEDFFGIFMKRNLEAGKRNYTFEEGVLNSMKRLEVKNSLDTTADYIVANETDMNFNKVPSTESGITKFMMDKETPLYDIFGGDLIILTKDPIINVTEGLKLSCFIFPEDITSLTIGRDLSVASTPISFGMPKSFHLIWADLVTRAFKDSQEKPLPYTEGEKYIESRIQTALENLSGGNLDRDLDFIDKYNDGSQY